MIQERKEDIPYSVKEIVLDAIESLVLDSSCKRKRINREVVLSVLESSFLEAGVENHIEISKIIFKCLKSVFYEAKSFPKSNLVDEMEFEVNNFQHN
jgi:hypothetical protein